MLGNAPRCCKGFAEVSTKQDRANFVQAFAPEIPVCGRIWQSAGCSNHKNHKNNGEEGLKTLRSEALQTWTRYRIVQGINNFLFLLLVHDGCTAALWPET